MKRRILGILLCLLSFALFANAPEFEGGGEGEIIPVENIVQITLINYSGLNEIDMEFCLCKDSEWKNAGKITECPFGKEVRLASKEYINKVDFVAYKCNLPADKKFAIDLSNGKLTFYVDEASNTVLSSGVSFVAITEDPANGLYKFDTIKQRSRYENEVRVKNAPRCIIMFQKPKSTKWEVYGYATGDKIKVVTSYHKDIDRCEPYWVVSICEDHKAYAIATYTKHNDLCFEFSILDEIVTPEPVKEATPVEAKPAVASEDDMEAQLLKLKQLYDGGLIDEDEYKEKKSKVLGL